MIEHVLACLLEQCQVLAEAHPILIVWFMIVKGVLCKRAAQALSERSDTF